MLDKYVKNPKQLAIDIKETILSGDVNPLIIKVMYDVFSDIMKDRGVKSAILDEADLHGEEVEVAGFRYKKANRRTYSYKHDATWQEIDGKKKAREEQMKTAIEHDVIDTETGELVPKAGVSNSEFLKRA